MRPGLAGTAPKKPAQPAPAPAAKVEPPKAAPAKTTTTNSSQESRDLFLKKLQFCKQTLDFNDEGKNSVEKTERLKNLAELSEILTNQNLVNNLVIPNLE